MFMTYYMIERFRTKVKSPGKTPERNNTGGGLYDDSIDAHIQSAPFETVLNQSNDLENNLWYKTVLFS